MYTKMGQPTSDPDTNIVARFDEDTSNWNIYAESGVSTGELLWSSNGWPCDDQNALNMVHTLVKAFNLAYQYGKDDYREHIREALRA